MSLSRNSTEKGVPNCNGSTTKEMEMSKERSTLSTLLSLLSTGSTKKHSGFASTKDPLSSEYSISTLSAGLRLNVLVSNSTPSHQENAFSILTSQREHPVSSSPRWRKKMTFSNTTTTTHVTTTQSHVTTQSLSTFRRTTLTTTMTILPETEGRTAPSTAKPQTQTVTNVRITENFSNVTYVTKDWNGVEKEARNATTTEANTSQSTEKPSGYNQSIITPLVTPLLPIPVNGGGYETSEQQPTKTPENILLPNRKGPAYSESRPISYWKPKDRADVHLTDELLNKTNNALENKSDNEISSDYLDILLPLDADENVPVAAPLIHRLFSANPLVSSSSAAPSSSSSTVSSSWRTEPSSTSASTLAFQPHPTISSSSNQTSLVPSTKTLQTILTSAKESLTSKGTTTTNQPTSVSQSTKKTTTQKTSTTLGPTTLSSTTENTPSLPTMQPYLTELILQFTNPPTVTSSSSSLTTTQATTNGNIVSETTEITNTERRIQFSPSQTTDAMSTASHSQKHQVAPGHGTLNTKSSTLETTSLTRSAVEVTTHQTDNLLSPKPSVDAQTEHHIRSEGMVNNDTSHDGLQTDHMVGQPTVPNTHKSKKPLGIAKSTVPSPIQDVNSGNSTLGKMAVGPVSKPSNTNIAAVVVPVMFIIALAGIVALVYFRKRTRESRHKEISRKESMDVTTPLHVDLEQGSPIVASAPVYAKVDMSRKKTRGVGRGFNSAVQFHDRPSSEDALLSSIENDVAYTRRGSRNSDTSIESFNRVGVLDASFEEDDLKIEDEGSKETFPWPVICCDAGSSRNNANTQGGASTSFVKHEAVCGDICGVSSGSPLMPPRLVPPIPFQMPDSEDETSSESDFEELISPNASGSEQRTSILEDYSEPTLSPETERILTIIARPHFYDQVYIPRSAINNFVDSTNYVKGRKRSDSVHTNPYEEIGPAGGAAARGPVPSTSGAGQTQSSSGTGRGMAIYATVDETRMDGRKRIMLGFFGHNTPPDMSPEQLNNLGHQGAAASPTLAPLLPTKRSGNSFRGPPLLLSRRRSRRWRTRTLPPGSKKDMPPSLPERPPTPRRNKKTTRKVSTNEFTSGNPTCASGSLDLLESGCCDVDLDVPVPPSDDSTNPSRVLLPPALPDRTQLPSTTSPIIPIRDRPLPDPEAKPENRPLRDVTSTTARTVDIARMATYDVDLDTIVPPSRENLEDSFAPLVWLISPEPRYSGLLRSRNGCDDNDSVHQYTSLDRARRNSRQPRPLSQTSSKSDSHLDRTSASSSLDQYRDLAAYGSSTVLQLQGDSDTSDNRSSEYDSVHTPTRDPIYESVGSPSMDSKREA